MERSYEGGCHCGRVRFRVNADLSTALVCNCSVCTKKGFLHVVVAAEQFILLSGAADLTVYEFNTRVAKHRFCRHCGVHPFYTPRSDPNGVDVNARCLDGIDPETLKPGRFDGQNWEQTIQDKRGPKVTA